MDAISFDEVKNYVVDALKSHAEDFDLEPLDFNDPDVQMQVDYIADDIMGRLENLMNDLLDNIKDEYDNELMDLFPDYGE